MKKIPTLFKRDPDDMRHVLPQVTPGCEWVLEGEGVATRKYDGTCVMLYAGTWWARREVKPGKDAPPMFRLVQTDEVTGKRVGWEPIRQSPFAKAHGQALIAAEEASQMPLDWDEGTYELIGPKVNGNPERRERHELVHHADAKVLVDDRDHDLRSYDALREWVVLLQERNGIEGVVWHHPDGRMAKLKGRDFQ